MKLSKLGKKLRREAAANPKKAAFLGFMAIVALYFWMPLIKGWLAKDESAVMETTNTAVAASASPEPRTASTTTAAGTAPERPSWQQIDQWMRNDPRTMIAPPLTQTRDPFETPKLEVVQQKVEEKAEVPRPTVTPTTAGLVLSSTIIGPQRRVVHINGKMYSVGQTINVGEKEGVQAAFKLVDVQPRRAVLQNGNERYELTIPEPGSSEKIEIRAGGE